MKKLDWFFATPKRAAVSISCIAAVAFLGTGTVFAANVLAKRDFGRTQNQAAAKGAGPVSLDGAIAAALYDAGLNDEDVTVTKAKRDEDDGIFVYDIEFTAGNMEYEYEIYGDTGAVYSKSKETIIVQSGSGAPQKTDVQSGADSGQNVGQSDTGPGQSTGQSGAGSGQSTEQTKTGTGQGISRQTENTALGTDSSGQNTDSQISLDEAKSVAVSDAGLTLSEVTCTKAELEYEDGIAVYEIKFNTPTHEYEYELYASNGAIRSKDMESYQNGSPNASASAGTDIGLEQAKAIALNHAGCQASEVHFSKAKFEKEHGSVIYEVEFYRDGIEYEYKIDATTGEILEFDSEEDD